MKIFVMIFLLTMNFYLPIYSQPFLIESDEFDTEWEKFLLNMFTSVVDQRMDDYSGSTINTPAGIQGNWVLNRSLCFENHEWIDRIGDGIIMNIKNNDILFNGISIKEDVYYSNIRRILTGRGYDFLHGRYYVVVFSLANYTIMSHRYYFPIENFMRVEYWTNNGRTGISHYNAVNITGFTPGIRYITDVNLRLRSAGNLSAATIRTMQAGESILVLELGRTETIDGITSSWIRVRMEDGTEGWCFGGYVSPP